MNLQIENLADHPTLVPTLADWFAQEWGGEQSAAEFEAFKDELSGRMNRNSAPFTLISLLDDELVGTAALKIREMESHPHYEYWLGSVYVRKEFRGRGVASELIHAVIEKAAQLGIDLLHLYTRGKVALYANFGWKIIEEAIYLGKKVYIMQRREER